jgi:ZIP family zinc transporter
MLSISLCDLLPEAAAEIGVLPANLCFYAGVALFAAIVALIPEPQLFSPPAPAAPGVDAASTSSSSSLPGDTKGSCLLKLPAAAAEAQQSPRQAGGMRQRSVGGGAAAAQLPPGSPAAARLDTSCGGAGSDQQQHLQPLLSPQQQQQHLGPPSPGSADSADLQVVLKYDGKPGSSGGGAGAGAGAAGGGSRSSSTELERREKQQLLMSGVVTAVGIALHNFPEGVAVFLASQKSTAVGEQQQW